MPNREIYIICTLSDMPGSRGRYVKTATTDRAKATATADKIAADCLELYGLLPTERQTIQQEPGGPVDPEAPAVVEVLHLRNAKGDYFNVEIYRVQEPGQ